MFHIKILTAVVFTISNLFERGLYRRWQLTGRSRVLSRSMPDFNKISSTVKIVPLRSEVMELQEPPRAGTTLTTLPSNHLPSSALRRRKLR